MISAASLPMSTSLLAEPTVSVGGANLSLVSCDSSASTGSRDCKSHDNHMT